MDKIVSTDSSVKNSESNAGKNNLDIDAHVIRQLGAELVTDAEQALLELVKNTFDADSDWCNVSIDTSFTKEVGEDVSKRVLVGKITIVDNGCGMDLDTIRRGWLTISLSPKRQMKLNGIKTPKHNRTPLGDKGLGRLGTMKLGNELTISTHPSVDSGHKVTFDWDNCVSGTPLSSVPVAVKSLSGIGRTGTTIEICGLNDPKYWVGENRLKSIQTKLSSLISPFSSIDDFLISLTVDSRKVDLITLEDQLKSAVSHFELNWDGTTLSLDGEVKLDLFKGKDEPFFEAHVAKDNGDNFFKFLANNKKVCSSLRLRRSTDSNWFIKFEDSYQIKEIPAKEERELSFADPGTFSGEIYGFAFDNKKLYSSLIAEFIKEVSGVSIFRDKFRVRAGDWLRLSDEQTSGSWYGLRPNNTVGYFSITGADNPKLIEKSDREGFVENAELRAFDAIAKRFKKFANDSLERLGRSYGEYKKERLTNTIQLAISPEEGAQQIEKLFDESVSTKKIFLSHSSDLVDKVSSAILEISSLKETIPSNKGKSEADNLKRQFDNLLQVLQEDRQLILSMFNDMEKNRQVAALVNDRLKLFKNQMDEIYESVGIGLTAQALAHEIHPFVDEIAAKVRGVKTLLIQNNVKDIRLINSLENIRQHAVIIGKKVSFLDPMLRTFRELKEKISVGSFVTDFLDNRNERFAPFGISGECLVKNDILITTNRGRLTQVIDNLVRNSEYWLRNFAYATPDHPLQILVEIDAPYVRFSDTGYGVRPPLEDVLFDIFVTDKPRGEGHGLGLFIVAQILQSEGCSITLSHDRNSYGRRYKFEINMSGALK